MVATVGSMLSLVCVAVCAGLAGAKVQRIPSRPCLRQGYNDTIYEYSAKEFWGTKDIPLDEYRGKVVLITNVATY